MTDAPARTLASAKRRRQVGLGVLRLLASAIVLVGLYYLLPFDHLASVPSSLMVGLLVLVAVAALRVRLPHPSNLAEEGRRVLFIFIRVEIAAAAMFLASQLQKRTAKAASPSRLASPA